MLFYVALTIACILAAAVCLWLFRSMVQIGKTAYRSTLPSGSSKRRFNRRRDRTNTHRVHDHQPWGGIRRKPPSRLRAGGAGNAREAGGPNEAQVPWGWPGGSGLKQSNLDLIASGIENSAAVASVKGVLQGGTKGKNVVGWPYRKERFEYSVGDRKSRSRKSTGTGGRSKPWGW